MPIHVQAIFQGRSGLARDQFVNNWYFASDIVSPADPLPAEVGGAIAKVHDWYVNSVSSVIHWYSGEVEPVATFKAYNTGAARPRPILAEVTWDMGSFGSTTALPEEVALCLSYYSVRNIPRDRGRIYVGPLADAALSSGTPSHPAPGLSAAMINGALRLLDPATVNDLTGAVDLPAGTLTNSPAQLWLQHSGTPVALYRPVTHGWVDNEWDTVRRRRVRADARVSF